MTWALVPLAPNEDTPARRGRPVSGQGAASVSRETAPSVQSIWGEGRSTCRVRGITPCRIASTDLITPPTPAAAWVWDRLDFREPSRNGRPAGRSCPYVAMSACASMGSPRTVPVPCASTMSTSDGSSPARASAPLMTRCCAGPFGAVSPLLAPSWLTAEPRMTARTGCPARRASESRSSRSRPRPSPNPAPSAADEKDLLRPSGARPRWRLNPTYRPGVDITVTPPARARVVSPERSPWQARWTATREDEQAVSRVTAGPSRPRV